jgi:hypothetical protein
MRYLKSAIDKYLSKLKKRVTMERFSSVGEKDMTGAIVIAFTKL